MFFFFIPAKKSEIVAVTKELLDKLSGGNKTSLLIQVLDQHEKLKLIADYTSDLRDVENDFEAAEPKVEVKSEPNSQVDLGDLFSLRSNLSEDEDRLIDDLCKVENEILEADDAIIEQDDRTIW